MRSRLQWTHQRGEYVTALTADPGEAIAKYLVLAFVIWIPGHILHWPGWIPFVGASLYLLWELTRVSDALNELTRAWNDQYRKQQADDRGEHRKRREQPDTP